MRRGRVAIVLVAALCAPVPVAAEPAAATPSDFYTQQVRDICHLPRPGNNGKVLGHDVGWSVRANATTTVWFFGDTFVDYDGDGVMDNDEFITGTIARSTDNVATGCVDMDYKTDGGSFARVAVPPSAALGECLTWPFGGFVANGKVYFPFSSVRTAGRCGSGGTQQFHGGLARVTNVDTLSVARVAGVSWPNGWEYIAPVKATSAGVSYVYLFNQTKSDGVHVVRVPESSVEVLSSYRYWTGSAWSPKLSASRPIFSSNISTPNFSFDRTANRWVALGSCGVATAVCARTAKTAGPDPAALTGAWNDLVVVHEDCGTERDGFRCYQGFRHDAFSSTAPGGPVFVSSARHELREPLRHYWVTLREYRFGTARPPVTREFFSAEADFSSQQGKLGWTYKSDNVALTWNGSAWTGAATISTLEATPGTGPADRRWTARTPGTVSVSGEAWIERSCSDGVTVSVRKVAGGTTSVLWSRDLSYGQSQLVNLANVAVNAGDAIVVRVARRGTSTCDLTYFAPSLTFDASFLRRSAEADFIDGRRGDLELKESKQGFRGWAYEECATPGYLLPTNCKRMATWVPGLVTWQGQSGPTSYLFHNGGQPPNDSRKEVARAYTAEQAGNARITAVYWDGQTCAGRKGVSLAVFKNNQVLWSKRMAEGTNGTLAITTSLAAGDVVRFVIHNGGDGNVCDITGFNPTIDVT